MIMLERHTSHHSRTESKETRESEIGAEVDKIFRSVIQAREIDGDYALLHRTQGGIRMLIGTSMTLLSTPKERHNMATYIYNKELEIHESEGKALRCLRGKGWSQNATFKLLEHVKQPNFLKEAQYQVYFWLLL